MEAFECLSGRHASGTGVVGVGLGTQLVAVKEVLDQR
jgi:hypothetical protein